MSVYSNLASVGALVNLRILDSQGCAVQSIPAEIGECRQLTHLNLAKNLITSFGIPYSFSDLEKLTSLNLRYALIH